MQKPRESTRRRLAKPAKEEPEMIVTTIALDAETHRRLRYLAVEERTTFRELIRTAIAEHLSRRGGGK